MLGRESIVEILKSHYGTTSLVNYSESHDEIRFQVPTPIRDRQTAAFRSRAPVLNELAVSHRLSPLVARRKCGVPEEFAFAIRSVETAVRSSDVVDGYHVSLRCEATAARHGTITTLRSTLVTNDGVEARTTMMSFNVLPPSLAHFVRRARHFVDFANVRISRDKSDLATVTDDRLRYWPSEDDRLSDGKRVDHMPALTLIDIALFVNGMAHHGTVSSHISAEFLSYTDPREAFDIVLNRGHSEIKVVQNGQLAAIVLNWEYPSS
jgi:hypothetical protein